MKQIGITEEHYRRVQYEVETDTIVIIPGKPPRYSWEKRGTASQRYRVLGAFVTHRRYCDPEVHLRSEKVKVDGTKQNNNARLEAWDIKLLSKEDRRAIDLMTTWAMARYKADYGGREP